MILTDDEGKLHWKYTCVYMVYLFYVISVEIYMCIYVLLLHTYSTVFQKKK